MPIPKPKKGEKQAAFIGRCMGNPIMVKEYKDSKQRSAICYSQWRGKNNMHINSAIINVQSRPAQFMGRDHVVVPVIMVVEGVHAGSAGPMFYPSEEIKATAEQWDGVPVTVQHPRDKDDNLTVAANAPESIIGHISKSVWDDKLRAEVWIDIEKANNISSDIMTIIRGNGQLEVSTGLFSSDEIIKADWKGESYNAIVRDIVPDHLALLPGEKGACSWVDGCGIRANKEGGEDYMMFKGFDMSGLEKETTVPEIISSFFLSRQIDEKRGWEGKFKTNELSHSDIRNQIQNQINNKDTQNQWNFIRDVFDKFFIYSKEHESQPTQMFKQGYNLSAGEVVDFTGDEIEVVQKTEYILKNNKKFTRKENDMGDKKEKCCPEKVKALIANEKSNYVEKDAEWLENMEEAQLDKVIANTGISEDAEKSLITAAVEKAFEDAINNGEMVRVEKKDPNEKEVPPTAEEYIANAPAEIQDVLRSSLNMHKEKKTALVQQIVTNEQNRFTQAQLEAKEMGELENIAALIPLKVVDENGREVSYAANSGNTRDNTCQEEPLEMPTIEAKK